MDRRLAAKRSAGELTTTIRDHFVHESGPAVSVAERSTSGWGRSGAATFGVGRWALGVFFRRL